MNFFLQLVRGFRVASSFFLVLFASSLFSSTAVAQRSHNYLNGKVLDDATLQPVYGVKITQENGRRSATTLADGTFSLEVGNGSYTLQFSQRDYESIKVSGLRADIETSNDFTILLKRSAVLPTLEDSGESLDSTKTADTSKPASTLKSVAWAKLSAGSNYNPVTLNPGVSDLLTTSNIRGGRDLNAGAVVNRLQQVSLSHDPSNAFISSLSVSGFAERYNQFLLDGAPRASASSGSRSFQYDLIPAEAVEKITVDRTGWVSAPMDYAGGSINLTTKAKTDHNFFYVLAGGGFAEKSPGSEFYGEARGHYEYFGFPGRQRAIPGGVPTAKSQYYLNDLNPQEQIYQSRKFKNNLGSKVQDYYPDSKLLVGLGRNWKIRKRNQLSVVGYFQTLRQTKIESGYNQTGPNVTNNPFPFTVTTPVIYGQSTNNTYAFNSASIAMINGTYSWGNNTVSFRSFGGSMFQNNYTNRTGVSKPGEDTLANGAVSYFTDQQIFINASLSGDHALGPRSLLHFKWVAAYNYVDHQNPDERNILLRQAASNTLQFELATPLSSVASGEATFTNNARQWRTYKDNNFNGTFSLSFPFSLFRQMHTLDGGLFLNSQSRTFYSDFFTVTGAGYTSLAGLFDQSRYFIGGLTLSNYYVHPSYPGGNLNFPVSNNQRANYTGSASTGAAFIGLKGNLTPKLYYKVGLRGQNVSNLVSNFDFQYFTGFKNPRNTSITENETVQRLVILPSAEVKYTVTKSLSIAANYYEGFLTNEFSELSGYRYYDGLNFQVSSGNVLLTPEKTRNSSVAISFIPTATTSVSIGGFYKIFDAPVENFVLPYSLNDQQVNPYNSPYTVNYGVEANLNSRFRIGRETKMYSLLTIVGSGSLNKSQVDAGPVKPFDQIFPKHRLSGVAPAAANGSLTLSGSRFPELALQYSYSGETILARGTGAEVVLANGEKITAIPDYRLAATHRLHLQISQRFLKNSLQVSAGVQNLLANNYLVYQDLNGNEKFDEALKITTTPKPGYFLSGTDNAVRKINGQRTWFFSISYQLN
jgi:CarboxypepD_reg-like domain/TonB-dependent Receptor Plug Domain